VIILISAIAWGFVIIAGLYLAAIPLVFLRALLWALRYVILTLILGVIGLWVCLSIFPRKQPEPEVRRAELVYPKLGSMTNPARPKNPIDYNNLPFGSIYIDLDGVKKRKLTHQ
jgi:hypothetical protein